MQRILACAIVALAVLQSEAACPNSCGGHGTCGTNDQCTCYQGFRGNGCEQRVCPYGRSWATTPVGDINGDGNRYDAAVYQPNTAFTSRAHVLTIENMGGAWEFWPSYATSEEAHFDMECSNAGLCDRELGQCTCFDGFEGSACDRSTCPGGNYCNGNGRCMTISQLVTENNRETGSTTTYTFWDADHMRACQCDPGFTGIGCDEMRCPLGDDPMTKTHQIPETQRVRIYSNRDYSTTDYPLDVTTTTGLAGTFTLTYKNLFGQSFTTDPINVVHYDGSTAAQAVADDVEAALEALPNSHIPSVDVTAGYCEEALPGSFTAWATGSVATSSNGIRCPGIDADKVVALDGTSTTILYFPGSTGSAGDDVSLDTFTSEYGCTQIVNPFCIELQITFSDKANTGDLNLLTVDVTSVTDDGKTNDQYAATYISAEVVKTWDMTTSSATNTFVPSNTHYAPLGYDSSTGTGITTFDAIDIASGTITLATGPLYAFPAGATVELLCTASSTIYNMGKYVLASTIVGGSGTSVSVAFESSINDPKTRCSTTGGALKLVTAYVSTNAKLNALYTPLYMTYGLQLSGSDIDSTVASIVTYDTTNEIGYLLMTDTITSPAYTSGTVALKAQATGTMEADECSGRGLCDSSTGLCTCFKGYSGERCDTQNALWVGADSS